MFKRVKKILSSLLSRIVAFFRRDIDLKVPEDQSKRRDATKRYGSVIPTGSTIKENSDLDRDKLEVSINSDGKYKNLVEEHKIEDHEYVKESLVRRPPLRAFVSTPDTPKDIVKFLYFSENIKRSRNKGEDYRKSWIFNRTKKEKTKEHQQMVRYVLNNRLNNLKNNPKKIFKLELGEAFFKKMNRKEISERVKNEKNAIIEWFNINKGTIYLPDCAYLSGYELFYSTVLAVVLDSKEFIDPGVSEETEQLINDINKPFYCEESSTECLNAVRHDVSSNKSSLFNSKIVRADVHNSIDIFDSPANMSASASV